MHDVFMTANLMRVCMDAEPIPASPEEFSMSRRGRFERCFLRDLAVVLETWRKWPSSYERLRPYAQSEYDTAQALILQGTDLGLDQHLIAVRDYMCHRDQRIYWDEGRLAVARPGVFEWSRQIEEAFGTLLLVAMRAVEEEQPEAPA